MKNLLSILLVSIILMGCSEKDVRIDACDCAEKWLATPKKFMKAKDEWRYDVCVREYGGWAGAHSACNP